MKLPLSQTWHALGALLLAAATTQASAVSLSAYNADPAQVTVSGISSGGAMAVQAHVAYSGTFKGAAVFAGAAFYCAQGSLAYATGRCMEPVSSLEIPVAELVSTTRNWASQGLIDNPANLANTRLYLFSGTLDQTVRQPGMDAARDYYLNFTGAANITYSNQTAAGHGWISLLGPNLCALTQSPYINNCAIDPQQTFLSKFYGSLKPKQTGQLSGQFLAVDQTEFVDDRNPNLHGLDTTGWLYVPASCARGDLCRVHVAYHGCNMSYSKIGDQFVRMSGLNEWADTNNILVLYPQVFPSLTNPVNGQGCWDWWGYDDPNYAQKNGRQLLMTKRMVDRINADYAPVAAPQGLTANISGNGVRLYWGTVGGAIGYRVYRDGVQIAAPADNNFTDRNVQAGTTYVYTVRAVAANGKPGPASAPLTVRAR